VKTIFCIRQSDTLILTMVQVILTKPYYFVRFVGKNFRIRMRLNVRLIDPAKH
jgi:hypothetical protein